MISYLCLNGAYVLNDPLTSKVVCDVKHNDVEGARGKESLVNTLTHLRKWKYNCNLRRILTKSPTLQDVQERNIFDKKRIK